MFTDPSNHFYFPNRVLSVPHVHFHILPRKTSGDRFSGDKNDEIYPALEQAEHTLPDDLMAAESVQKLETKPMPQQLKMDADENRTARTMADMEREANWLKTFFRET